MIVMVIVCAMILTIVNMCPMAPVRVHALKVQTQGNYVTDRECVGVNGVKCLSQHIVLQIRTVVLFALTAWITQEDVHKYIASK
jgi:hypothetical protein